jgi:UDP-N-acetylmuramate dehydrogenase
MKIIKNEPLAKHTNYKIGGNTPQFIIVNSIDDLINLEQSVLKEAYILGVGTNLLVSDNGVDKPVIKINLTKYYLNNNLLTVEAGVLLKNIGKITASQGLRGLVHVSGIPGSIGGGIVMNAGASYGTISDNLVYVDVLNKKTKERIRFKRIQCNFGKRESIFKNNDYIVLSATFDMKKDNPAKLLEIYKKIWISRNREYPLIFPSAGCCFKKFWGGKDIISKVGMAGEWEGNAVVSPLLPAFILNTGDAKAKDIYNLIKRIKTKSKEVNEEMPLEIIIWGEI